MYIAVYGCICIVYFWFIWMHNPLYKLTGPIGLKPPLVPLQQPRAGELGPTRPCSARWRVSNYQTFREKNVFFRPVLKWSNLHQQYVLNSYLTRASNYKSSKSYFNQLDQQADGIEFWLAPSISFMNPMVLSPSKNRGWARNHCNQSKIHFNPEFTTQHTFRLSSSFISAAGLWQGDNHYRCHVDRWWLMCVCLHTFAKGNSFKIHCQGGCKRMISGHNMFILSLYLQCLKNFYYCLLKTAVENNLNMWPFSHLRFEPHLILYL